MIPCAPACSSPLSLDNTIATRARDAAQLSSTAHSAQPPGTGSRCQSPLVGRGNFGRFSCGPYTRFKVKLNTNAAPALASRKVYNNRFRYRPLRWEARGLTNTNGFTKRHSSQRRIHSASSRAFSEGLL